MSESKTNPEQESIDHSRAEVLYRELANRIDADYGIDPEYGHETLMQRVKFLLECERSLQKLAEQRRHDPEGYLPDEAESSFTTIQALQQENEDLKRKLAGNIAHVAGSCGRLFLSVAGITVAAQGDQCRDCEWPNDVYPPLSEEELATGRIGDEMIRDMPLELVKVFRPIWWDERMLRHAADRINQSCGSGLDVNKLLDLIRRMYEVLLNDLIVADCSFKFYATRRKLIAEASEVLKLDLDT